MVFFQYGQMNDAKHTNTLISGAFSNLSNFELVGDQFIFFAHRSQESVGKC